MISNSFSLKQLEALIWVADLGSFRGAAAQLNTTQPNISARIAGLEQSLGVTLFIRAAGTVEVTETGIEILALARKTLRDAENIAAAAGRSDLIQDRLRLGVTELIACTWLHAYLRVIKSTYPDLRVELTVDLSRNLDADLAANRLDLALQNGPFTTQVTGNVALGQVPYVWAAGPALAGNLSGPRTLADLVAHPILTHARHTNAYNDLSAQTDRLRLSSRSFVPSNSLTSCVEMAADDMGVAMLPQPLVTREVARGRLVQLAVDWVPSPLSFAARYHADRCSNVVADTAHLASNIHAKAIDNFD